LFCLILCFADSRLGDLEKKACQVLCRLRNEGDEAKEVCGGMRPKLWYATELQNSISEFLRGIVCVRMAVCN
jgi:hypothetical protein